MSTMQVSLPEPLKAFIDQLVAEGTFKDRDDYLRTLVDRDRRERLKESDRLEAMLIDGLDSGPSTPTTAETWDQIRQNGKRLLAERKAAKKVR